MLRLLLPALSLHYLHIDFVTRLVSTETAADHVYKILTFIYSSANIALTGFNSRRSPTPTIPTPPPQQARENRPKSVSSMAGRRRIRKHGVFASGPMG